jgi:hypothetical protein
VRCVDSSIEVTVSRRFDLANRLRIRISHRPLAADPRIAIAFELAGDGRCEQ